MTYYETLEKVKLGARINYYNGIYALVLGFVFIALSNVIVKMNFNRINIVWKVFSQYNSDISSIITRFMIFKGLFIILAGIFFIYLSAHIYKRKEKTAWLVLSAIGLLFWSSLLIMEILDRNILMIILSSIGGISFIIGLIFPIRYYLLDIGYSSE
jgi:hypothetical protein